MKSNLLTWLAVPRRSDHRSVSAHLTWLQLFRLLVEKGQCDPTTAHHEVTNFISHQWDGPLETLVWLCRQDQFWSVIPVNGGLGHTYHSLAKGILHGGPSTLLNVLLTEERAPYILHSEGHDSRTVLFAAVWRQALRATRARHHPRHCDSSLDQLVTKLIQDGSDVHALDSSGLTPLNNAIRLFILYNDYSPFRAPGLAPEFREVREVFRIEKKQPETRIPGSQYGSEMEPDGSTDGKERFRQFLSWWFERLDDGGCDWNDYVRHENLQLPTCRYLQAGTLFSLQISKKFHYDKTAQKLELDLKWAWTKIAAGKD